MQHAARIVTGMMVILLFTAPNAAAEPRSESRDYVTIGAPGPCFTPLYDMVGVHPGCVGFTVMPGDSEVTLTAQDRTFSSPCFGVQVVYADGSENFNGAGSITIDLKPGAKWINVYIGAERTLLCDGLVSTPPTAGTMTAEFA